MDVNSFLAGVCFEKLSRTLKVFEDDFKSGNSIKFSIYVPHFEVDVDSIKESFKTMFRYYKTDSPYIIREVIITQFLDEIFDVEVIIHIEGEGSHEL